jgi:hypothetical protein
MGRGASFWVLELPSILAKTYLANQNLLMSFAMERHSGHEYNKDRDEGRYA